MRGPGFVCKVTGGAGHGKAPAGREFQLRGRRGARQEPPVGEEADQGPGRVAAAEAVAEPHGRAAEQVQRMPERRSLRRRPDQQLPVHEHGLVHASSVQPLRVGAVAHYKHPQSADSHGTRPGTAEGPVREQMTGQ